MQLKKAQGRPPVSMDIRFHCKYTKDASSGCWQWTSAKDKDGYGLFESQKGKTLRAHRFSVEYHTATEIPKGVLVCHSCDNPSCVNPEHLFLGSPKDNTQDMIGKGRKVNSSGEANGAAKLTEGAVRKMRKWSQEGGSPKDLAITYGISLGHTLAVLNYKAWRHI